jgi:hypothetical protein
VATCFMLKCVITLTQGSVVPSIVLHTDCRGDMVRVTSKEPFYEFVCKMCICWGLVVKFFKFHVVTGTSTINIHKLY